MPVNWAEERARAGTQTQRSLVELAERAGYQVSAVRGKGSHYAALRPGLTRPITIPAKIYRQNALGIIGQLERGSD